MIPPKPAARTGPVPVWRYARLFYRDILSAQPEHLFRARMAEFRTPLFRSFLVNEPDLVDTVLRGAAEDWPKPKVLTRALAPLLGNGSFVSGGTEWSRQRGMIDPAFGQQGLAAAQRHIEDAATAAVARLRPGRLDAEEFCNLAAADVIFRTLFSRPIEEDAAQEIVAAFRRYQEAQPLLDLPALLGLPSWVPGRARWGRAGRAARLIRGRIGALLDARLELPEAERPHDLVTALIAARDDAGRRFSRDELLDQVAVLFLAGHETGAAAMAWALYLLATHPEVQARAAAEAIGEGARPQPARLVVLRAVMKETLRLYPPVPMILRSSSTPRVFRGRRVAVGDLVVVSPWHLHRHERYWDDPDRFDPDRWSRPGTRDAARAAYCPFSAGPRACPGAGFAMMEAVILLAAVLRGHRVSHEGDDPPIPAAKLTTRSRNGIALTLKARDV